MARILLYGLLAFIIVPIPTFRTIRTTIWEWASDPVCHVGQWILHPIRVGGDRIKRAIHLIYDEGSVSAVTYQNRIRALEAQLACQSHRIQALESASGFTFITESIPRVWTSVVGYSLQIDGQMLYASRSPVSDMVGSNIIAVAMSGLVGRVIQRSPWLHHILLISDRRSLIPIQTLRGDQGILCGQAQDAMQVRFMPADHQFKIGDVLVTSGLGGVFPKNIPIARVIQVEPHIVRAEPMVNTTLLDGVYLMPYASEPVHEKFEGSIADRTRIKDSG
jgi:cell shape-determining protein MreC